MQNIKVFVLAVVLLGLFAAPLIVRTALESRYAFERGTQAISSGDLHRASDEFRSSIAWGNPYFSSARDAVAALDKIASNPSLPIEVRRNALVQLRSGVKTSRSIFNQQRDEDPSSEAFRIETIRAQLETREPPKMRELSQKDPNYLWQVSANISFWGWILSFVFIILRGFSPDCSVKWSRLPIPILCSVITYSLWLISLRLA